VLHEHLMQSCKTTCIWFKAICAPSLQEVV